MRLTAEDIKPLLGMTMSDLSIWMIQGLRDAECSESRARAFLPYSFVMLFDPPVSGLMNVFSLMPPGRQDLFRDALADALYRALPNRKDLGAAVTPQVRSAVINGLLYLVRECDAWKAVPTIDALATQFGDYWERRDVAADIYARCMYSVSVVSSRPGLAQHLTQDDRKSLHSTLEILVASPMFRVKFAPTVLRALIAVCPEDFADHLDLLGDSFNLLHQECPEEADYSYLTANLIAERAPNELHKQFYRLSFSTLSDRDTWLIDALICEKGPFKLIRMDKDVLSPKFVTRAKPYRNWLMTHPHWEYYQAESEDVPDVVVQNKTPAQTENFKKIWCDMFGRHPDMLPSDNKFAQSTSKRLH